ncbi:MAG: fibronectin type III domain-containing protein, partial [Patescibacteria group bacterium]
MKVEVQLNGKAILILLVSLLSGIASVEAIDTITGTCEAYHKPTAAAELVAVRNCWGTASASGGNPPVSCAGRPMSIIMAADDTVGAGEGIDCPDNFLGISGFRLCHVNLYACIEGLLFSCTGTTPSNAGLCSGDDASLTADTAKTLVSSCGSPKCEYTCNSGYTLSGGSCVPITYSCTGTTPSNANLCSGDDALLTADTAKTLVSSCGSPKCEYTCNSGYVLSGGSCMPGPTKSVLSGSLVCASTNMIDLSWTDIVTQSSYTLGKCIGSGCGPQYFGTPFGAITGTSYSDSNLLSGNTYEYGVQCNSCAPGGNSGPWSNVVSITNTCSENPLPAPTLTLDSVNCGRADLSWTQVSKPGLIIFYRMERKTDGGSFAEVWTTTSTSDRDSGSGGIPYTYRVRADAFGPTSFPGAYSNEVTGTMLSCSFETVAKFISQSVPATMAP